MTRLRKRQERPANYGPADVKVDDNRGTVVYGGSAIPLGKTHPNLLRGRDRHFGAKLADPGKVFNEAVEAAVEAAVAARMKEDGK